MQLKPDLSRLSIQNPSTTIHTFLLSSTSYSLSDARSARDALQLASKEGYIKFITVFEDIATARTP